MEITGGVSAFQIVKKELQGLGYAGSLLEKTELDWEGRDDK
ncbi:MAG: hypothetical protein ABIE47_00920 [Pseudomonadota bacterium]